MPKILRYLVIPLIFCLLADSITCATAISQTSTLSKDQSAFKDQALAPYPAEFIDSEEPHFRARVNRLAGMELHTHQTPGSATDAPNTLPLSEFSDAVQTLEHWIDHRDEIAVAMMQEWPDRISTKKNATDDEIVDAHGLKLLSILDQALSKNALDTPKAMRSTKWLTDNFIKDGFKSTEIFEYQSMEEQVIFTHLAAHHQFTKRRLWDRERQREVEVAVAVFLTRKLKLLSLRICDAGVAEAEQRFAAVARLLAKLNEGSAKKAPVFIRNAYFLPLTAASLPTPTVEPYLRFYEKIRISFGAHSRLEFHKAHAQLLSAHLRSNAYHPSYVAQRPPSREDFESSRSGNFVDLTLLILDLAALLEAYKNSNSIEDKRELESKIFQGVSADPWLLLGSPEQLRPMILHENLFFERIGDNVRLNAEGEYVQQRLETYLHLRSLWAASILSTSNESKINAPFSPYGVVYLLAEWFVGGIAKRAFFSDAHDAFGLEDAFHESSDPTYVAWADTLGTEYDWAPEKYAVQKSRMRYAREFQTYVVTETLFNARRLIDQKDASIEEDSLGWLFIIIGHSNSNRWSKLRQAIQKIPALSWHPRYSTNPDHAHRMAKDYVWLDSKTFLERRAQSTLLEAQNVGHFSFGTPKLEVFLELAQGKHVVLAGLNAWGAQMIKIVFPKTVQIVVGNDLMPDQIANHVLPKVTAHPEVLRRAA